MKEINIKAAFEKAKSGISILIQEMETKKSLSQGFSSIEEYKSLVEFGILKPNNSLLILNFEYPTCLLISQGVQEDFRESLPISALNDSIPLARKIVKALNKHGITSGTADFHQHVIAELILNAYLEKVDLSSQILELNRNSQRYFEIANSLSISIPDLPLPLPELYDLYAHTYGLIYNDGASQSIFISLQKFSSKVGTELLTLTIQKNNKLPGFVSNILLGLAEQNSDTAWNELVRLSKGEYELETLNALTNTKIQSEEQVKKMFYHLKTSYGETEINIPSLIWAYGNIINSPLTSEEIKQECIDSLKAYGKIPSEQIHSSLVSVANNLNINEEVKIQIISTIDFARPNLIHRVIHAASKFSTPNFFFVIRELSVGLKLDFKPQEIEHYLLTRSRENPEEFSQELISLLTDKVGMIRLAGSRILQVIHSEQQPFDFSSDLLSLSEHHQVRMIKAIVLDFLHPQDVIRFLVIFRNSKYQTVLQILVDALATVFEDYHHDGIIFLRKEMDVSRDVDKQLLDIFEKYHSDLAALITKKNSLEEFSPHKNQARQFYSFMQLTKHKMREKFNKDQRQDSLFSIMKTVSIARGKSWKIESKAGDPSPLQEISTALTYPRMCLMNPDQYNWEFIANVNSNYKNG